LAERICIVIPNYNGSDLLDACLTSIKEQTYTSYEVVVVDNGSNDNSLDIAKRHGDQITIISLSHNLGFGRAVNRGILSNDSELVFVLNNDTVLSPNCLTRIIEAVDAHCTYGFFAPKICEYDEPDRIYAAGLMLSNRGYGNRSQRFLFQSVLDPLEVFGACGAGAVYRRRVLEQVGLFNEDYIFLYEDLELSYRHQLKGHRCLYIPSAVLFHRGSVTLHRFFSQAVREAVKNSLTTLITCTPAALFRRYFFDILIFYFRFWVLIVRKGFTIELLGGIGYNAFKFFHVLKRRSHLQTPAVIDIEYLNSLLYRGRVYVNFPDDVVEL